jgi:hypothetical protein
MNEAEQEAIEAIEHFDGDPLDLIPILDEIAGKHLDRDGSDTSE